MPWVLQPSYSLHKALSAQYPRPPSFPGAMKPCEPQENLLALKYEKKTAELELINVLLCVYKT